MNVNCMVQRIDWDGLLKMHQLVLLVSLTLALSSCSNYFKNDYDDNSPTSGKLKVYYDVGLAPHIKNQQYTFEALYPDATVELTESSENEAIQALYMDSCESIVITRKLNPKELSAFQSKQFNPQFSAVAKTGIALITNASTQLTLLPIDSLLKLLTRPYFISDTSGNSNQLKVVFDGKNSSVLHYLSDTLLKGKPFSNQCRALNNTLEAINYVAENKDVIACIDFAWLSDSDDSLVKANKERIKFLAINKFGSDTFELPNQSSFKLGTYPLTRTIYVYRKTGDFTLAKGFESFVAGPKGQLTFLKQGLLPFRQGERNIEAKLK